MEIRLLEPSCFDLLVPLLREWEQLAGGFGVPLCWPETTRTIKALASGQNSALLVLMAGEPAGFMGLHIQPNHVGPGTIAHECLYFVGQKHRRHARQLIIGAERWATAKGCHHLVLTASRLANPQADRVERYYGACGYQPFEATFIKELDNGMR